MPFSLARCPVAAAAPEPVFRDPILADPLHLPHQSERSGWPVLWAAFACVAGPLFAVAAAWWRRGRTVWHRSVGLVGALGGLFGAEGLHYAVVLHYATQAWACAAVALAVSLLALRGERIHTLAAVGVLTLIGFAAVFVPLAPPSPRGSVRRCSGSCLGRQGDRLGPRTIGVPAAMMIASMAAHLTNAEQVLADAAWEALRRPAPGDDAAQARS